MASIVIGSLMLCAHLDSGAMSTDTMFFLIGKQYDEAF
jgi:hypothetical protein